MRTPEQVSIVLSPTTDEIKTLLIEADKRWETAGVSADRIIISSSRGAPVTFDPSLAPVSYTQTHGRSGVLTRVSSMVLSDLDISTAMHEMGHALGIGAASFVSHPFPQEVCDVQDQPLMCPIIGKLITTLDLEEACSVGECTHFMTEVNDDEIR